ncbi:YeeE/YedE family protein [Dongia sp.]|uniref:YeeE/YedE family protein n=1 Tax=Dongia sp. TaxID=1977262 RepID=UPI0035AEF566
MDWTNFHPLSALLGGGLIGLAALILLLGLGRIAGVSGILGGLLQRLDNDSFWRLAFVLGIPLGALLMAQFLGGFVPRLNVGSAALVVAGLAVGFGTRLGAGCTSGHGICGLARLSPRSLVAVLAFMASAMATVFIIHHLLAD